MEAKKLSRWSHVMRNLRGYVILCYQNQIDNVCPEKIEISSMSQRSGVRDQGAAKSNFWRPLLCYKEKAAK